jgi:hypothetical protein
MTIKKSKMFHGCLKYDALPHHSTPPATILMNASMQNITKNKFSKYTNTLAPVEPGT